MDWKAIVSTVAPWIGTALGGPLGGLAVHAVGSALGLDAKSEDSIKQALAGVTPDQMLALKKADQDFALQMQALGFKQQSDLEKIAQDDRASARAREIAVKDKTPAVLAGVVVVGYIIVQTVILTTVVDVTMRDLVLRSLGTLDMALGLVLAYYFGSSAGSRTKDNTIEALSK